MPLPLTLLCGPSTTLRDELVRGALSRRPGLVAVLHDTDDLLSRSVVRRRVLDSSGTIEDVEVELAHGCVSCTIREDVLPSVIEVVELGRWTEVLLGLPVPVLPSSVSQALRHAALTSTALRDTVRLDGVTMLVDALRLREQLEDEELLSERRLAAAETDRRSVAELVSLQLEQADVIALVHAERAAVSTTRTVRGLLAHLAPLAVVVPVGPAGTGCEHVVSPGRAAGCGPADRARLAVLSHELRGPVADVATLVWRADRPLHPTRLHAVLADVVKHVLRSTGQVELANRPGVTQYWESASTTVSLATAAPDEPTVAGSELVLTGVGLPSKHLSALLDGCLVSPTEWAAADWSRVADPFACALGAADEPVLPDAS